MKYNIKEIRMDRKVTQQELADRIGVTKGFICRVETGTKPISLDLAAAIADYLNVSLDELAGRKQQQEKE